MTKDDEIQRASLDAELQRITAFRAASKGSNYLIVVGVGLVTLALLSLTIYFAQQSKSAAIKEHAAVLAQARAEDSERALRVQLANLQAEVSSAKLSPAADKKILDSIKQTQGLVQDLGTANTALGVINGVPAPVVLAQGVPAGWDVDVFWCSGDGDGDLQTKAKQISDLLAGYSNEGTQLAPGIRLGRVRVRPLTETMRAQGGWFDRGLSIVQDGNLGEAAAASAIATTVQSHVNMALGIKKSSSLSKWYLSVFICR